MSSLRDIIEQERGQGLRAAGTAVVRAQWREGSQQRRPEGNGQGRREAMWHKVSQGQEAPRRWWLLCTWDALGSGSGGHSVLRRRWTSELAGQSRARAYREVP